MKELNLSRTDQDILAGKLAELREADRKCREARGGKPAVPAFSTCGDGTLLHMALEGMIQDKNRMTRHWKRMAEERRNVGSGHLYTDGQCEPEDI